jgi:SAM-dependent methyltransferase
VVEELPADWTGELQASSAGKNPEMSAANGVRIENALVRILGWKATVLHGDPCVLDRWRWVKRNLESGPLRTLDAGCGSGAFTLWAAKVGNESVGVSFDERNTQVARLRASILGISNVRFITADLRVLDKHRRELGTFDQIICLETIEHILNDKKLIEDLVFLLKPNGRLLLTTPYKKYKGLLGDAVSEYEDGGHVRWGYTHEEMRELFEECGLDVVSEDFISGVVSQQLTNLMRILGRMNSKIGWVLTFPLRMLQVVDFPVTALLAYPYMSIGMVGRKRT